MTSSHTKLEIGNGWTNPARACVEYLIAGKLDKRLYNSLHPYAIYTNKKE